MSRYPGAEWRPLPENSTQGPNRPRLFIVHTMVGWNHGSEQWFRRDDVKSESHFGIARYAYREYPVRQWMDTDVRADTNWDANGRSVTVEMEDEGDPTLPFTTFQLNELVNMGVWTCRTHDIPPVLASAPDGEGLGWHSLFPEWNRSQHGCPGPVRVDQLRNNVFPRIAAALNQTYEHDEDEVMGPKDIAYWQTILAGTYPAPHDKKGPPYDIGAIDGVVGPKTQAAIKDWQRRRGIEQTGTLNVTTCSTLQSHANRVYADSVR